MNTLSIENLSRTIQVGDAAQAGGASRAAGVPGAPPEAAGGAGGSTFADVLRNSINQANEHQVQADQAIRELVAGRTKNIHETMLAVERADSSLKLMMQVRNKVLDAYREVMRMQV